MTKLRLHALGTGTCLAGDPSRPAREHPLFVVEHAGGAVVFDCGEGAARRLLRAGHAVADVEHVAVTHPHADHAALPQLLQARSCEALVRGARRPLEVYLPAASAAAYPDVARWHQPEDGGALPRRYPVSLHGLGDGDTRALPGATLLARRVHHGHGESPALAYRLTAGDRVFAYSGDTGPCDGVVEVARGADLFVCEASARIGQDLSAYGHLSPRQAGEIARAAGARSLLLTHYSGLDPAAAMVEDARASGYAGWITVLTDGQIVEA
ncbi:MAG: MBL fold metallo-hydrolase [Polyangiaceae bacterium]|nr:MBL fold metallo-hydrolase [Polyangiaceae bacterium]